MVNRRVGTQRRDRDDDRRGGGGFNYRPPPADHVKRQAERRGGKFDSIFKGEYAVWTPREGENCIRVLPAGWDGHTDYAYPVWVHYGIGADESSYLCPRKMGDTDCPICEEVRRMKSNGEVEDAKRIDCKERFICWIIDRDDRDEDPQLYSMPPTLYKDINALCYSKIGGAIYIDDPDNGYDVKIRRTGTKKNTKYLPQVEREPNELTRDQRKYDELGQWVRDNPVPDCLDMRDADFLEKSLQGQIDHRNRDDDGDDRGRGRDRDRDDRGGDRDRPRAREDRDDRGSDRDRPRAREDRDDRGSDRPRARDRDERDDRNGGDRDRPRTPARGDRDERGERDRPAASERPRARADVGSNRGEDDGRPFDDDLPFNGDDRDRDAEAANEAREARGSRDRDDRGGRSRVDDDRGERPRARGDRDERDDRNGSGDRDRPRARDRDDRDRDDDRGGDRPRAAAPARGDRDEGRSGGNRRVRD